MDPKCVRMWSVLHEHFVGLCGPVSRFIQLRELVLCGPEWKETVEDDRFTYILRLVVAKGVRLVCEQQNANESLQKALRAVDAMAGLAETVL